MGLGKLSRIFNYESDAYLYHKICINVDICTRALISVMPHDPCVTIWRCVYGLTLASLGRFAASRSEGPARAGRPYNVWQIPSRNPVSNIHEVSPEWPVALRSLGAGMIYINYYDKNIRPPASSLLPKYLIQTSQVPFGLTIQVPGRGRLNTPTK